MSIPSESVRPLPLVYSDRLDWRLARHLAFWLAWFGFQLVIYSFSPSPALQKQPFSHRLMITWPETAMYMVPSLFLAYVLMYLLIPKLILPGRYGWAALGILAVLSLTAGLSAFLSVTVIDSLRHRQADALSPLVAQQAHPAFYVQFGVAMLAGLRGSITVGGVAAAIKLMKCHYQKQQAALLLEKEKADAQLHMLKAQLHPHFLFNTLNNIYCFTQDVSLKASGMILGLSELLRYILYECDKPLVPLDRELKMITDYLALETARYDQGLDLSVQFPQPTRLLIAPLLLLPFVENAFKHGASQMSESPWITLSVEVNGRQLSMKLINGKPGGKPSGAGKPAGLTAAEPGIGIGNVRKRLELLYPGTHRLRIHGEEEMYIVSLEMTLATASDDSRISSEGTRISEK